MRGYPDFFGYPNFPSKGVLQNDFGSVFILAINTWYTVLEVTGKGNVLGGIIYLIQDGIQMSDFEIKVSVDGMTVYANNRHSAYSSHDFLQTGNFCRIVEYSVEHGRCVWDINREIDFNYSYKVEARALAIVPGQSASALLTWQRIL